MITGIDIQGFKRFRKQSFDLGKLTILAGLNGAGKTSLIHAFLLAWETSATGSSDTVRLNEPFGIELGSAEDIRNWNSEGSIAFNMRSALTNESVMITSISWRLGIPADDALYLTVEERPELPPIAFNLEPRAFSYLCAERLGPRSVLGASPLPADQLEVGVRGQYCAQILATLGNKPLEDKNRVHPEKKDNASSLLKYEVERWLGEVARPIEIDAVQYVGSAVTSMRFRPPGATEWVLAPNMGFGVSYALPVILAGLIAKSGGLMIVENPEAHLHPAGQSRMGAFLAWLAGHGVQVILETHSDHVLNGIRRAIGEHNYLGHEEALVHFFESAEGDEPVIHKLGFTSIGGISHWPRGFFDQYQIDVASLGRIRRRS